MTIAVKNTRTALANSGDIKRSRLPPSWRTFFLRSDNPVIFCLIIKVQHRKAVVLKARRRGDEEKCLIHAHHVLRGSGRVYVPDEGDSVEVMDFEGVFLVVAVDAVNQTADLMPVEGTFFLLESVSFARLRLFGENVSESTEGT